MVDERDADEITEEGPNLYPVEAASPFNFEFSKGRAEIATE
jgi:hypothetical protein